LEQFSYKLISKDRLEKMAETLRAISHPTRLQIINILMNDDPAVWELVKGMGTKQCFTSLQLSILKSKGVLKSRKNGNAVYYSIKESSIKNIMAAILLEIL
jgi:DNA-binding transcriptional ArsR family regulator